MKKVMWPLLAIATVSAHWWIYESRQPSSVAVTTKPQAMSEYDVATRNCVVTRTDEKMHTTASLNQIVLKKRTWRCPNGEVVVAFIQ